MPNFGRAWPSRAVFQNLGTHLSRHSARLIHAIASTRSDRVRRLVIGTFAISLSLIGSGASTIIAVAAEIPLDQSRPLARVRVTLETKGGDVPLNEEAPPACRAIAAALKISPPVRTDTCHFTLANSLKQASAPNWERIDPNTHLEIIKEAAFWEFWETKIKGVSKISDIRDATQRQFVEHLYEGWRDKTTQNVSETLSSPPENVDAAIREGWSIYGPEISEMIGKNEVSLEQARFDVDGDGHSDQAYRITEFAFGVRNDPLIGKPALRGCRSPDGHKSSTSIIFLSAKDNLTLQRSFIESGWLDVYDTFGFMGKRYLISRPNGDLSIGWLSVAIPKETDAQGKSRGVYVIPKCDFEEKGPTP